MDIEILQEDRLRMWCEWLQMPEGAVGALVDVAGQIRGDEKLFQIFCAFHEQTALRGEWHREYTALPMDSEVVDQLGEARASLFYLLAYMAALPYALREYRRLGISREVFLATMYDITIWTEHAHDVYGDWCFKEFIWIWHHLSCELFRLGRLQYILSTFHGGVMAFKNRSSGRIMLMGDPEMPLRADGYAEGAGGREINPDERWFATFEATPAGWRGNRVAPQGYTLREAVFLLRSEWEPALRRGDTILDLHIPRGEKMTMESCRDSFLRAFAFFPEHWPDRPFKGVYCHTWFFTPQLQQILPPESNIVQFQREFYLYPYPGGPDFLWRFVFGEKYPDPATAPRDTFLRGAALDWLEEGKELFDLPGIMLHRPEQWGTQPYYYVKEAVVTEPAVLPIEEELEEEEEEEDASLDTL